jgi:hypothetical protein
LVSYIDLQLAILALNMNYLFIGISTDKVYARVNSTFKISCSGIKAKGKLNFYENQDLIPDDFIKVEDEMKSKFTLLTVIHFRE